MKERKLIIDSNTEKHFLSFSFIFIERCKALGQENVINDFKTLFSAAKQTTIADEFKMSANDMGKMLKEFYLD